MQTTNLRTKHRMLLTSGKMHRTAPMQIMQTMHPIPMEAIPAKTHPETPIVMVQTRLIPEKTAASS